MKTETVIAANRFGLGARPGDLEIIDRDPRSWLLEQIDTKPDQPAEFRRLPNSADLVVEAQDIRKMQRNVRQRDEQPAPDIVEKFGRFPHRNELLGRESTAEEEAYIADGGFTG